MSVSATPILRAATPEDAALIGRLTREAWTGRVSANSSAYRESDADIAQQITEGGGFILCLEDTPIGSARYSPVDGAWEVRRVGVLPPYRGKGYSLLLMEAVTALARERDIAELRLAVRHDQPRLIAFYGEMGYELAPDTEYQHPNPLAPQPPTVMRRSLAPQT